MDEILRTHKITPEILRADDFEAFIRDRASLILDLIETAMDKKVSGRDSEEVIYEYGDVLQKSRVAV